MSDHLKNKNSLTALTNSTLVSLPAPANISTMWNFGSLLSVCLIIQITSGLILATAFNADMSSAFQTIFQNMQSYENNWLVRYAHANGSSLFFICLYAHIGRGLYYGSFLMAQTWHVGVTIFLFTMAAAFLGYVLPANQMSFWGASVITNLAFEIPMIGPSVVQLIWGSVSVSAPTLTRFYAFHFLLPFVILALVVMHITFLHKTGSSNPLGSPAPLKIPFLPFYAYKDMVGVMIMSSLFMLLVIYFPLTAGDDENFTEADPAVTPHHIQPEWYFLFAYAILRSIPNKVGGILALLLSVSILYLLPSLHCSKKKGARFSPPVKLLFWVLVVSVVLLTWIGARPVEPPYILTGQILTALYFSLYLASPFSAKLWDKNSSL